MLLILCILFNSIIHVNAQTDFSMFLGNTVNAIEIDEIIGQEYNDVTSYTNMEINPQRIAEIWLKHDKNHLFTVIQFTGDLDNPWVALQLENTDCMTSNTDGALLGHDSIAPNEYQHIYFGGLGVTKTDFSQNLVGAIDISTSYVVTIELKKTLIMKMYWQKIFNS